MGFASSGNSPVDLQFSCEWFFDFTNLHDSLHQSAK
jgi:hypothetical protein